MNGESLERSGWSILQWIVAFCFILAVHLFCVFFFSKYSTTTAPLALKVPQIHFLNEPVQGSPFAEILSLQDPMVFLQMDMTRFSQTNWAMSRFSYVVTNRIQPFPGVSPSEQHLADDFIWYVASTVPTSRLQTEKIPPMRQQVPLSPPALPTHAVLKIEGALAGRRSISNQPLPLNEGGGLILSNTVVGVTVDARGETLWATLISSGGSEKADRSALAFARRMRFERLSGAAIALNSAGAGSVTFGQLVFQWFPVAASPTNQVAAKP